MTYNNNETNWGPIISQEVQGGSHLTFEIALKYQGKLVGLLLKEGIHGGDNSVLYFPHGLMRFGETVDTCVERVVQEVANVPVTNIKHLILETWLDESDHFHICHNILATIGELPKASDSIREVICFSDAKSLKRKFAWWTEDALNNLFKNSF